MTEYVLVSDIHGNAPSLKAILDKEGYDKNYVVLGDIVGLCSYPKETVQTVKEISDVALKGNHGKAILQKGEGHVVSDELSAFELEHTVSKLSDEQVDWMKQLPHLDVIEQGGQRICLTHALPWPEMASGYEEGNMGITKGQVTEIAATVNDDYNWVWHGHSHQQYDLDCSKFQRLDIHFVNPGSLGYQQTYSTVDTETGTVTHKSVDIDMDEVEAHISDQLPADCPPTSEWF